MFNNCNCGCHSGWSACQLCQAMRCNGARHPYYSYQDNIDSVKINTSLMELHQKLDKILDILKELRSSEESTRSQGNIIDVDFTEIK